MTKKKTNFLAVLRNPRGVTLVEVLMATMVTGILAVAGMTAVQLLTRSAQQLEQQSATDQLMATLQGQVQAATRAFAASTNQVGTSIDIGGVTDLEVNHAMNGPGMPFDDEGMCPDPTDCPDKARMKGEVWMYLMQSTIPGLVETELRYKNPQAFQGTRRMVFLTVQ